MLIVVDHRINAEALCNLQAFGEVVLFPSSDEVYPAISSHPDIFLFQKEEELVVAPNTPESFVKELEKRSIEFRFGLSPVGPKYPSTVKYNAAYKDGLCLAAWDLLDEGVQQLCSKAKRIQSRQGYARCNHLILKQDYVLTSDLPTAKMLDNALYIYPQTIELAQVPHGFFGGCCGIYKQQVYVNGSLDTLSNGQEVREYIRSAGFAIIELHGGILQDVGGLFFLHE